MQLSALQDHIISLLKNAKYLRYSDMRPEDTENDLYNYHLKQLIVKKLVIKTSDGYALSDKGLRYVADVHHTNDQTNRLFKMNVITIVSRIIDGEMMILNQVRGSNPSYGKVGVMGGTVIKGEPLEVTASRKLKEETGITATFRCVGWERRMRYVNDELFSDVLFPITYTNSSSGEPQDTMFGHNMWVSIDEAIRNESDPSDSILGITTVLKALKNNALSSLPLFFHETTQNQ